MTTEGNALRQPTDQLNNELNSQFFDKSLNQQKLNKALCKQASLNFAGDLKTRSEVAKRAVLGLVRDLTLEYLTAQNTARQLSEALYEQGGSISSVSGIIHVSDFVYNT